MSKYRPILMAALRHPLPWGAVATVLFYVGLDAGLVSDPLALRYLTGHWAAYVCTTMFLVGIAAVVVKAIDLTIDYLALNAPLFDGLPVNDLPLSEVKQFTQRLDAQPVRIQPSTLIRRLRSALDYLSRKGTTENLEDELRSLADLDAERKHASYGIVRMMLWAMPFIGSLGTVVGIGQAIANLGPDVSVSSISAVTPGLELVFDTTALALVWSVLLMMAMFIADHVESRLLAAADTRTNRELVGRFRGHIVGHAGPIGGGGSGASDGAVVEALEKMADRQSDAFQASLNAATKHWPTKTNCSRNKSNPPVVEAAAVDAMAAEAVVVDLPAVMEAVVAARSSHRSCRRSSCIPPVSPACSTGNCTYTTRSFAS